MRLPGVLCLIAPATLILLNAQGTEPLLIGSVTVSGSMRSRIESWDWFTAASCDHAYTFDGSTLRLGFTQTLPRFDWMLELEAPVLLNLPSNSVAPGAQGQLGQGRRLLRREQSAFERRDDLPKAGVYPLETPRHWLPFPASGAV
jgi:hypothetical protein